MEVKAPDSSSYSSGNQWWWVIGSAPAVILIGSSIILTILIAPARGADWASCQDDLDRLRRAARDAADEAERVKSQHDELESKASEVRSKADDVRSAASWLQLCRGGNRDCSMERWRYNSALSDYESAKSAHEYAKSNFESAKNSLQGDLDTVSSRVRSAESSCEYDLGSGRMATFRGPPTDRLCAVLRRFKGKMSDQALMDTCKKSKSEEECKRCLE